MLKPYEGASRSTLQIKAVYCGRSCNYSGNPRWLPGQVTSVLGPVSYQITVDDG